MKIITIILILLITQIDTNLLLLHIQIHLMEVLSQLNMILQRKIFIKLNIKNSIQVIMHILENTQQIHMDLRFMMENMSLKMI